MDTTTAQQVTLTSRQKDRFVTGWAIVGLVSLLPIVAVSWLLVLSGERGSACLMNGEQCSGIPGSALYGAFWPALVSGIAALAWPRTRGVSARLGAVFVQWGAQLTLAAMILSGA